MNSTIHQNEMSATEIKETFARYGAEDLTWCEITELSHHELVAHRRKLDDARMTAAKGEDFRSWDYFGRCLASLDAYIASLWMAQVERSSAA